MKTKTKEFDCVEMQDQAALRIYAETKGMSVEEELAYWRRQRVEVLEILRQPATTSGSASQEK